MATTDPHARYAEWRAEIVLDDEPDEPVEWGQAMINSATEYLRRHPECNPKASRATVKALVELEAHMPAALRERVWPRAK